MNECLVEDITVQDTLFDNSVFDNDVVGVILALGLVPDLVAHRQMDRGKQGGHHLLAGPEWDGVDLCRRWNLAIPALAVHQEIHVFTEVEELRGPR